LDLLANIATPQIGQCLMDRGLEAIEITPSREQTLERVSTKLTCPRCPQPSSKWRG